MARRIDLMVCANLLVAASFLAGCGGGHSSSYTVPPTLRGKMIQPNDIALGAPQWAKCYQKAPSETELQSNPDPAFFGTDGAATGDLVPSGAKAVAVCAITGSGLPAVVLTGDSLGVVAATINDADRLGADGVSCPDISGPSQRLVFSYSDGRFVPVLLAGETCGWADNGAQTRYGLRQWIQDWEHRLAKSIARTRNL